MALSIGIVGLPNVGKSTLFNGLTKKGVPAENYPFCTIDPSVGIVAVPDERLWQLSKFSASAKTVPAAIEFVDIAGLVKGAAEGQGLGNQFLSHIRETDAILEVVRIFEDPNVLHVEGAPDPLRDIKIINLELIFADLSTLTKRLGTIEKDVKRGDKVALAEKTVLERVKNALEEEKMAHELSFSEEEKVFVYGMHLLTAKPILYALNKKAGAKNMDETKDPKYQELISFLTEKKAHYIVIDAGVESELQNMESEEKKTMKNELGIMDDGVDGLIRAGYTMLGLITYFTTGEDETRGWTIKKDSTAPVAGMAIHTDFKDKFIKADVIFWKDLLDAGSYGKAREKGLVRIEGKEYIVKDGDVIEFKI